MKKINSKNYIFLIFYAVGFLGAGIIGLLSTSFFAYEEFNSLWADILYLIFIAMLYITAFVQETITSRATVDVITNVIVFIVGLVALLLLFILRGAFILVALIFSAIVFAVISCRYAFLLRKNPTLSLDFKRVFAVGALLLLAMAAQMRIEYITGIYWAWALIPAVVLFGIAVAVSFVLLRKVWREIFPTTKRKSFWNAIGVGIIMFFVIYIYSATTIMVTNYTFDGEPTPKEYTVLEKHISTGSKTPTEFSIKVLIEGKERWINVPVTDYHEMSEGDSVIINYYSGALHFAYYYYGGIAK